MSLSLDRLSTSLGLSSRSHSRSHSRSPSPHPNPTSQILTFRSSPHNESQTLIERTDPYTHQTQPIFLFSNTSSKPNIHLSRLFHPNQQPLPIGTATSHTTSGYISVSLHNTTMKLKPSSFSGTGHHFVYPPIGKFAWKHDSIAGTTLALRDESGMTLARYKAESGRLEVLVPCDDGFLDMVVMTALAAGVMEKKNGKVLEAVGEVFGVVAG